LANVKKSGRREIGVADDVKPLLDPASE